MPKRSPLQLLRSQTPATGRRNAPPTTNTAARANLVRSPAWTNTAQKSPTRSLARSPARSLARSPARRSPVRSSTRTNATRRRNLKRTSGTTKTRLGRISLARSEPAPPGAGGALTTSIIYRHSYQVVLCVTLDVIVMCP